MNELTKAMLESERMYAAAAFAVKAGQSASAAPLASVMGDNSYGQSRPNMSQAAEQLRYFKGWVYAAIRPIMNRIAAQPICVGRVANRRMPGTKSLQLKASLPQCFKSLSDKIEPIDNHPLLARLADPNELQTSWQLMAFTVASLELTGQCLWVRDDKSIFPIPSSWIQGIEGGSRRETFIIQPPGINEPRPIPSNQCAFFYFPHPSDPRAIFSPLQAAALPVETDDFLQNSQRLAFDRGIMPKVVLTAGRLPGVAGAPGERPIFTATQRTQLVNAIKAASQGMAKWNEPLILDGLIENVEMLGRSIAEMDFLNSGDAIKARIHQIFGVNPVICGQVEDVNRASSAVADDNFCSQVLNPIILMMSTVLTEWLAPAFARPNEKLIVWIEECTARDPEHTLKQWQFAGNKGYITANEYRRHILNLPDIDGGDELPPPRAAAASAAAASDVAMLTDADGKRLNPNNLKQLQSSNGNGHARH